ncbi:MAG: hypothetical protein ACR2KJ_08675 [Jatrophihabitans sp.]
MVARAAESPTASSLSTRDTRGHRPEIDGVVAAVSPSGVDFALAYLRDYLREDVAADV